MDDGPPFNDALLAYRRLVVRLLYLTTTRPDISFATQQLSQCMAKQPVHHHRASLSPGLPWPWFGRSLISWNSKKRSTVFVLPKRNTVLWHQLLVNSNGSHMFFVTFTNPLCVRSLYIVTARVCYCYISLQI